LSAGVTGGTNGKWVFRAETLSEAVREEKAPKGESHERCRCETKPARERREKTVMRVPKP